MPALTSQKLGESLRTNSPFLSFHWWSPRVLLSMFSSCACRLLCLFCCTFRSNVHAPKPSLVTSSPTSLLQRELLKFTPVFSPEQLLLMEMSLLKVREGTRTHRLQPSHLSRCWRPDLYEYWGTLCATLRPFVVDVGVCKFPCLIISREGIND